MWKKFGWLLVGPGVVALIVLAAIPKPEGVEAAPVAPGPFRQTVDEDAKTRVRERYMVAAPVAGTLARITLHEGDTVEPGTVVARLSPLPSPLLDPRARDIAEQHLASTRDAHSQAAAAVVRGEAAARLAEVTLTRDRQLEAENAVTAQQVEKDEADARMQRSELDSLRFAEKVAAHAVDEARLALETFSVKPGAAVEQLPLTSPVHGRVLHVLREDAGVVEAGTSLVEIGDPATLEIVVPVLSQDAVSIRPGMGATLTHWGGGHPLLARVERVDPAGFTKLSALGVEEQRVNVWLELTDPEGAKSLGDGFALEAQVLTWSAEDIPQIPTSALFHQGTGWAVFAIENGKATIVPVTIGHRGPLRTELVSGLAPGTLVISHPEPTLKAGTRVRPLPA